MPPSLLDPQPSRPLDRRHLIVISTACPAACLDAVSGALSAVGGDVRGFSLKPVGQRFEAVLRLGGVDDAGAERAAGLIHAWPDAGSALLEHEWVRP
jgi:hypothetical protein